MKELVTVAKKMQVKIIVPVRACRCELCGGVNDINVEMPIQEVCDYT